MSPVRAAAVLATALLGLAGCGYGQQQTAPKAPTYHHYVALGDTYAAAPYTGKTHGPCKRSDTDYAHRVAKRLHISDVIDVSCNLAKPAAMQHKQRLAGAKLPPQMKAVTKKTQLVTLQVGGNENDLYSATVTACQTAHTCQLAAREDTIDGLTLAIRQDVDNVINAIQQAAPQATIVLVGYPRHVTPTSHCAGIPKLSKKNLRAWDQIDQTVNLQLQRAAWDTATPYVDVYAASAHHDICSHHPWVHGKTTSRPGGIAYGPTKTEQAAVARMVTSTARHPAS